MKSNIGVGFPRRVLLRRSLASGLGMLVPGILQGGGSGKIGYGLYHSGYRSIHQSGPPLSGRSTNRGRGVWHQWLSAECGDLRTLRHGIDGKRQHTGSRTLWETD